MKKIISVFCGSHFGKNPIFEQVAIELGSKMARQGRTLIYGGSGWGYMGAVKKSAKDAGGHVVGVLPTCFSQEAVESSKPIDELLMVASLPERKDIMIRRSDAFIAIPGGIGTLDEISEVLTANQLGFVAKPMALLNVDGFFDHLVAQLDVMHEQGLVGDAARRALLVAGDVDSLLDMIDNYLPVDDPQVRSKMR